MLTCNANSVFCLWRHEPLCWLQLQAITSTNTVSVTRLTCDTGQLQVPCDPRDAAVMQAIEDGDAAVRRVFQRRLHATLSRHSQSWQDAQHANQSDSEM